MCAQQSINEIQDEIVDEFSLFDNWEDRFGYIIDIGKKLAPLDDRFRTDEYIIKGCQSTVWLHPSIVDGCVVFQADSNTTITRGLIALLVRVYSDQTADAILSSEPKFIERIGISANLSPTRANGLGLMVKQIKLYAAAYKAMQVGQPAGQ